MSRSRDIKTGSCAAVPREATRGTKISSFPVFVTPYQHTKFGRRWPLFALLLFGGVACILAFFIPKLNLYYQVVLAPSKDVTTKSATQSIQEQKIWIEGQRTSQEDVDIKSVTDALTRYGIPIIAVGRQLSLPTTPQTVEVDG
ncbi:hypothetical protein Bbelb_341660 [Branchiostoma belcheri]|nr:hypothetical protein Bbelb_341660 [Branchiostoma belcheri]